MYKHFLIVFLLSFTFINPGFSLAADSSDSLEQKIDQLMSQWDNKESPGAAIGVVKDGKLVFAKGYGMANLEYGIPITPSSIFHMASVSKQFTAFAVAMLAAEGKISLDDEIHKYFPEMPGYGKPITVKNLLYHTSGLRDQWELIIMSGKRLDDVITKDDILRLVMRQKELNFNPGEEHLYCNTGYTLLAEIVSRVTGKTFDQWTKENIFTPLGMNDTFFYEDHERIVKNRAYSYNPAENGFKKSNLNYANAGATSLFTNINDLVKWVNNFYDPVAGTQALIKQMEQRGTLNKGDTIDYAFGQVITSFYGHRMIVHNGADAGYRTALMRFPDEKIAIIVLSNLGSFNVPGTADNIACLMLGIKNKMETPAPKEENASKDIKTNITLLKDYEGTYQVQPGFQVKIIIKDDHLVAEATGQPSFNLEQLSDSEFVVKQVDAHLTFKKDMDNKVNEFILEQGNQQVNCKRVVKEEEPVDLSEYAGTYYSPEVETEYTLSIKDNKLEISNVHINNIQAVPAGKDKFTYMGFITFTFERNQENKVEDFRLTTGRVRNVIFRRKP